MEALLRLKSTEPPLWLAPSAPLSEAARTASQHLFASLRPHVRKSPFDELLVDNFDAEQIWQQIDLLTQPLVGSIRRRVKHWEKNPEEIENLLPKVAEEGKKVSERKKVEELNDDGDMDMDMDMDMEDDEEMDVDNDGEQDGGKDKGDQSEEEEKGGGIEDKFLKIKELQEHLEDEEARHYGLDPKKKSKKKSGSKKLKDEDEDSEENEEEEEEEEDEELDLFAGGDDEEDEMGNARYEDFFGKRKESSEKKARYKDELGEDSSSDEDEGEEELSSDDEEKDENANEVDKPKVLSTHEKEVQKIKSEIEKMEKANLDPKTWTMQGEVTAANRPKNSALEVDLDFEHNVRPVPVITEEVTQSLEEIIKKRIIEGQFDDIKKAPGLPSKAPRELKTVDENKSNKGLAEVYEEEYVQQTDPAAAPLSFSDEQKKEVIEDMSIQSNVPALAMEEIAPVAVSDAAMLAPEEVFSGKGNVKAEVELTQTERKRRRAKKKRKFKAVETKKMASKKAREDELRKQKEAAGNLEEQ
ncbi:unnamed protein product [Linum tenue]|uniref:U3 small nucleolar ribonucleoprotein protein MPP10 n=1 Tax=Linum tenue TaxID=586396 RepID=A0AAV0QQD4_9ROSI|nr:unnamed protein product [Linum tenue]